MVFSDIVLLNNILAIVHKEALFSYDIISIVEEEDYYTVNINLVLHSRNINLNIPANKLTVKILKEN